MSRVPAEMISSLSLEIKQRAQRLNLLSPHSLPAPLSGAVQPHPLSNRRSIKEEYGVLTGYGEDTDEMDPFVRVETMPMQRIRGSSSLG
jgi:hypothetical protein